jgi:hypothetical protein
MEHWKSKLTPFDAELAVMVESLTGKPCELCNGDGHYFFEVNYSLHNDPDYINAIIQSIEGRLGGRLISVNDDADRQALMVRVQFSEENYPGLIAAEKNGKAQIECGLTYCKKMEEVKAVQVKPGNASRLIRFVGNGEMEIPKSGECVFHFLNACGTVYAHAKEGYYVVYRSPEHYAIVDQETFEREYELK